MKKVKSTSKLKKVKLPSISLVKKKLWILVSKRIKERDNFTCFTSGKKVEGMGAHCGHMFPSGSCGATLRYHPLNLHCQSYYENINLGGNGAVYALKFITTYGEEKMNMMIRLKQKIIKADVLFYLKLIDMYTNNSLEEICEYLESL